MTREVFPHKNPQFARSPKKTWSYCNLANKYKITINVTKILANSMPFLSQVGFPMTFIVH